MTPHSPGRGYPYTHAFLAKAREERFAAGAASLAAVLLGAFAPHVLDLARIRSAPARRHLLRDDDNTPQAAAKPAPKPKHKAPKPGFVRSRGDPKVYALEHVESGRRVRGTRRELLAALPLTGWGLGDLIKGNIRTHAGWRLPDV